MRPTSEYDFAVNVRLDSHGDNTTWGFVLVAQNEQDQCRIAIDCEGKICDIKRGRKSKKLKLPVGFAPENTHQFGIRIKEGNMTVRLEDQVLGKFAAPQTETAFGIFCTNATVAVEMARLTVL